MRKTTTTGVLLAALIGALMAGPAAAQAPRPGGPQIAPPAPQSDDEDMGDEEAGPEGIKVCTVIAPSWRSIVPVPETWQPTDCANFARSAEAQDYRLGCMFYSEDTKFSWGAGKDAAPSPDCGWAASPGSNAPAAK